MQTDLNPKELLVAVSHFLHRYHVLIFVLVVLGGLSGATFLLYQTVISAQTSEETPASTTFDKQTIKKLNDLNDATTVDPTPVSPEGRTNPFKE